MGRFARESGTVFRSWKWRREPVTEGVYGPVQESTGMSRITTFLSTADRIYDGGPGRL